MTDARPDAKQTARPLNDGSGEWEIVDEEGRQLYHGSEKLMKARAGVNVNYRAVEHPRRKKKGAG